MRASVRTRHFGVPPSQRLGAPELAWLLDGPKWLSLLWPGILTYGVLWGLGVFPEGRIINPLKQYAGVFPGDLFLWVGMATAIYVAIYHLKYALFDVWYQSGWWKSTSVLVALVAFVGFTGWELSAILYNPTGAATYTWAQFRCPTHIAHLIIIPLMVYITFRLVIPVFIHAKPPEGMLGYRMLILVGYVGWLTCAVYLDNVVLRRPNLADIHPLDGGWLGGWWPHFFRWLAQLFS